MNLRCSIQAPKTNQNRSHCRSESSKVCKSDILLAEFTVAYAATIDDTYFKCDPQNSDVSLRKNFVWICGHNGNHFIIIFSVAVCSVSANVDLPETVFYLYDFVILSNIYLPTPLVSQKKLCACNIRLGFMVIACRQGDRVATDNVLHPNIDRSSLSITEVILNILQSCISICG